jgi:hypothetical protein
VVAIGYEVFAINPMSVAAHLQATLGCQPAAAATGDPVRTSTFVWGAASGPIEQGHIGRSARTASVACQAGPGVKPIG